MKEYTENVGSYQEHLTSVMSKADAQRMWIHFTVDQWSIDSIVTLL